jgi:hypothetical protein
MAIANVSNMSGVRPSVANNQPRPAEPAPTAMKPDSYKPVAGLAAGAAVGAGIMGAAFYSIRSFGPGLGLFALPGIIIGAVGGARIAKFIQDGFQAKLGIGAGVGAVALGGAYLFGGAVLGWGANLGLPFVLAGSLLAAAAGGAVLGAAEDGLVWAFKKAFGLGVNR